MKINPQTQIGHVHLTVSDLDRSLKFYRDILGFDVMQRMATSISSDEIDRPRASGEHRASPNDSENSFRGDSAVFLSAGGYHHHIALNTWAGKGAHPAPLGYTGLYHFAILYPTRKDLANALKSLIDAKYPLTGVADHGVSEALYLQDPDNNGVELYWDRPKSEWPLNEDGSLVMISEPLDLENLLEEITKITN